MGEIKKTVKAPKTGSGAVKDVMIEQNKDGKWSLRTSGSEKALKLFDTQKEAMEHGQVVAKNYGSEMRVKSKTGKVRETVSFKK